MTGVFETQHASNHLQQLCKHFGHKVDVKFDETRGTAALPCGETELIATAAQLGVTIALPHPSLADQGRHIIDSHLKAFAYREDFSEMVCRIEDD